ncbi:MAG: hypothetical protein PUP91_32435 [Rhizonema sp. PD37]|nr:hypothetical protein [Rhizonema sp. PD37]
MAHPYHKKVHPLSGMDGLYTGIPVFLAINESHLYMRLTRLVQHFMLVNTDGHKML